MADEENGLVGLINKCSEVINEIDRTKHEMNDRLGVLYREVRELQDRILTMQIAEQAKSKS